MFKVEINEIMNLVKLWMN